MSDHDEEHRRSWVARLGEDFAPRLASGLAMAAVVALFMFSGPLPFALLVVVVALLVSWEWGRLVHGPDAGLLIAVQIGTAAVSGLLAAFGLVGLGLLALPIGAILATLLSLGRNSFFSAAGVFYAGFPAVAAIWLRYDAAFGLQATIFLILIVVTADTAAFVCGRLMGGPLLSPRHLAQEDVGGLYRCPGRLRDRRRNSSRWQCQAGRSHGWPRRGPSWRCSRKRAILRNPRSNVALVPRMPAPYYQAMEA